MKTNERTKLNWAWSGLVALNLIAGNELRAAASPTPASAHMPFFGQLIERVLPSGAPCQVQYFQFHNGETYVVGHGPDTTKEEGERDWKRVDEGGGVDITAWCGSEGIQLVGRGCIFTDDVRALDWDTTTAGEVVQNMNVASFSHGVVEPRTKVFPITYLFKTSRGECGILQVLGVVEDERGYHGQDSKGHGMKFRYRLVQRGEGAGKQSLQIEPIEKASSAPALAGSGAMTFGPEGKGLRAAVELISSNGVFALGEPIEVLFHIRNTSSTNIYVAGGSWRQDESFYITIEDQQGRQIPAQHIYHSVRTPIQRNLLLPGESAVFHSSGLAFLAKDADGKQFTQPVGNYVKVTPGRYTVRYRLHFPDLLQTGFPQSSDWQGDLDTAPVTVEVTTANKSAAAPGFGPVIERVIQPCAFPGFPALDLDTGKVVTSGDAMPAMPDMESPVMEAWRQKTGADIVVVPVPNSAWQIRHFLALVQISSRKWDEGEMLPQQVKNLLGAASSTSGVMSFSKTPDPATFVFETRKRTAGIIQLLDVADQPRGVKLRYKLVQDVTEPPVASASAHIPSLGAVIERVLDFDATRKTAYLDLDTGEYVDPGTDKTFRTKATPAGVDLKSSAIESNFDVRWAINMAIVPVEPTRWEATAEEIRITVGAVKRQPETRLGGGRSTNTWFFQTSEGGRGVLQFLPPKAGDDPSQVRLRYRLVQPAPPSGASTVKPKATTEQVIVEDLAGEAVRGFQSRNQTNKPTKINHL